MPAEASVVGDDGDVPAHCPDDDDAVGGISVSAWEVGVLRVQAHYQPDSSGFTI